MFRLSLCCVPLLLTLGCASEPPAPEGTTVASLDGPSPAPIASPDAPPANSDAPTAPTSSTPNACSALSRTACLRSTDCTLEVESPRHRTGEYVCRPAAGRCEVNLAQYELPGGGAPFASPTAAAEGERLCQERPGCEFVASECYCACRGYGRTTVEDGEEATPCSCVCAGGPPVRCVES